MYLMKPSLGAPDLAWVIELITRTQLLFWFKRFICPGAIIGHFRGLPDLCIKTRLSAQPLIWK